MTLSIRTLTKMTFTKMPINIKKFSIMTLSIMTLSIRTLSKMTFTKMPINITIKNSSQ
jgi:hypothetical protein